MLPDTEVLTNTVLLKDAAHVVDVDGRYARLRQQPVGYATRLVSGVTVSDFYGHFLAEI